MLKPIMLKLSSTSLITEHDVQAYNVKRIKYIKDNFDPLRSKSKNVTFALQYRGTANTLVNNSGFAPEEAKEIVEAVLLFILTAKLLPVVTLAWGSTKVKVPAVKFIFVDSVLKIATAFATEVATVPELPSITIAPPDWLNTDVASALLIFPLTVNVPPEIVNVPLFVTLLLAVI